MFENGRRPVPDLVSRRNGLQRASRDRLVSNKGLEFARWSCHRHVPVLVIASEIGPSTVYAITAIPLWRIKRARLAAAVDGGRRLFCPCSRKSRLQNMNAQADLLTPLVPSDLQV